MIRLHTYRLPFRTPFRAAGQEWTHREGLLVEWAGRSDGWVAEAAPLPGRSPETLQEVIYTARKHRELLPDYIQNRKTVPDSVPPSLRFALSALRLQLQEARVSDNHLKQEGVCDPSRPGSLRMNGVIGLCSPEELEATLQMKLKAGYSSIKVKLDDAPEAQIQVLRQQTKMNPQLHLRIDANRSWNRDDAVHWLSALSILPVDYCEEPLLNPTLDSLDALQQATPVRIALDESLSGLSELREATRRSRLSTFILKATILGDLDQIAGILREVSRPIQAIWTTTLESAVARTTLRRAALAWGSPDTAHGLDTGSLFEQDLIVPASRQTAEYGPDRPANLNRHWAMPARLLNRSLLQKAD